MDFNPHLRTEPRLFPGTRADHLFSILRIVAEHGLSQAAERVARLLLDCEDARMSDALYVLYRVDGSRRQAGEWILGHEPDVQDLVFVLVELYEDQRDLSCRAWSKMARSGSVLKDFAKFQDSPDFRAEVRKELREDFEGALPPRQPIFGGEAHEHLSAT